MLLQCIYTKRLLTALFAPIAIAASIYAIQVYKSTRAIDHNRITITDSLSKTFLQSTSITNIVNPRGHQSWGDSYSVRIRVPASLHPVTDEELLAQFVKVFFGGKVLGPERLVFRMLRLKLVHFSAINSSKTETAIWSPKDLSEKKLPALRSTIYGAFHVLDAQLPKSESSGEVDSYSYSYIDFGWGSDLGNMDGVHRFSIKREKDDTGEDEPCKTVTLRFQSFICNPKVDRPVTPGFLFLFHRVYAGLLFREGIAQIEEWIKRNSY